MDQAYSRKSEEGLSIDLKEMIWRLLEQWRAILAFVLIIMILFSGLMYVRASGSSSDNSGAPAAVQTREQIINALAPADRDMVSAVYEMLLTKQNLLDYVNSAPVMKVDPYSANRLEMSWYIGADEALKSELASAYRNDLGSDGLASDIQKAWGDQYTLEQTKELIYTGYITNFFDDIDKGTDIINLKVFIPEGADAAAAEKAVLDNMAKVSAELQSEMGAHDLVLLSSQTSVSTDNDLANFQTNIHTRLYTVNYQINNMKALFNDSQKAAFEKLAAITTGEKPAEEEGTEPQEETKGGPSLLSKRNLAIGFILGVFLYGCIFLVFYLFSGKIQSPMAYERFYGLMTLGEWHSKENKKGLRALLTAPGVFKKHHKGHLDMQEEAEKATKTIIAASKMHDLKKLLVISGADSSEHVRAFEEAIRKGLSENGVATDVSFTDMKNGKSMEDEKLPANDGAIILVDRNAVGMSDVKDVIDKCAYFNTPLIGVVYAD